MVEVNEYFEGKVKSLTLHEGKKKKTVGDMEPGEYEFNTAAKETITVVSGTMSVFLAEYDEWEEFGPGSSFDIPADSSLEVKIEEEVAYLCEYE